MDKDNLTLANAFAVNSFGVLLFAGSQTVTLLNSHTALSDTVFWMRLAASLSIFSLCLYAASIWSAARSRYWEVQKDEQAVAADNRFYYENHRLDSLSCDAAKELYWFAEAKGGSMAFQWMWNYINIALVTASCGFSLLGLISVGKGLWCG